MVVDVTKQIELIVQTGTQTLAFCFLVCTRFGDFDTNTDLYEILHSSRLGWVLYHPARHECLYGIFETS
jgi:hypothetical protein